MGLPAGVDPSAFADLKKDYEAGRVVVFAGAGVSKGAGLPTWPELAKALVERMRASGKPKDAIDECAAYVSRGDLVSAMSAARLSLRHDFDRELKLHLSDHGKQVPPAARAIAALSPRLAAVVTTNLDRLIERALEGNWPTILTPVADLLHRRHYVFKPHGTIEDATTWVFTRDEYDRAMFGSQPLQDLFNALYRATTLLFVGASLTDDDFGLTLARIRTLAKRDLPTHYAILPAKIAPMRRTQLEDAGLRLLEYENKSGTHHEVVEILESLAGVASASGSAAISNGGAPSGAAATTATTPSAATATVGQAPASPATAAPKSVVPPPMVDVYLSAAPGDRSLVAKLLHQLASLEKTKRIRVAHEGSIRAGEDRTRSRRAYLDRATIVLLLLSAEYIASDDHEEELKRSLDRHDSGKAVVIPVYLRPCLWKSALGDRHLKAVPDKAVTTAANTEEALFEVVEAVQAILDR